MAGPLSAELSARTVIAPGIAELAFTMRSPERLVFRAGQFVSLALPSPSDETAGMIPRRSYSIASQSSAGDRVALLHSRDSGGQGLRLPDGAAARNHRQPDRTHGFFVLDPVHAGDIVFAATGTGIAAVMPMLGELAQTPAGERRRVIIYWGLRQQSDIFARDEIDALAAGAGAELAIHLTAPGPGWTGGRGRITPALLDRLPRLATPTFYLVGNGAMITELKRELISRGVNRKTQIRTEAFFD